MKNIKTITLLILVLASIILFCSCAAPADPQLVQRVNEALDNSMVLDAAHMKGTIAIAMDAGDISVDMNIDLDMKKASSEDLAMSMHMTGLLDTEMNMYGTGGKYYMYSPILSDKYIDVTSQFKQQTGDNVFMDMSMFDFDTATTSMNATEDSKTGMLMVDVNLNDEQMKKLIKKVYAEQNMGTDALSAQSQKNLDLLEKMHVDSAQYTIYMDKDDNIFKFELKAKISGNLQGKNVKIDMTASYDILEKGDAVKVEIPEIQPDNVITYDEILAGTAY